MSSTLTNITYFKKMIFKFTKV